MKVVEFIYALYNKFFSYIIFFFLAAALGDVRDEHDPNLTYEGENHVLIQQTTNWLLKFWPQILNNKKISSPLQSIDFLTNGQDILKNSRFNFSNVDEMCRPESKFF